MSGTGKIPLGSTDVTPNPFVRVLSVWDPKQRHDGVLYGSADSMIGMTFVQYSTFPESLTRDDLVIINLARQADLARRGNNNEAQYSQRRSISKDRIRFRVRDGGGECRC